MVTHLLSLRRGVMPTNTKNKTPSQSIIFAACAICASIIVNTPILYFEPLYIWPRIAVPGCLTIGLLGKFRNARNLKVIGWIGIIIFLFCGFHMTIPGEDFVSGGETGPPTVEPFNISATELLIRLISFMGLTYGLCSSLRR